MVVQWYHRQLQTDIKEKDIAKIATIMYSMRCHQEENERKVMIPMAVLFQIYQ